MRAARKWTSESPRVSQKGERGLPSRGRQGGRDHKVQPGPGALDSGMHFEATGKGSVFVLRTGTSQRGEGPDFLEGRSFQSLLSTPLRSSHPLSGTGVPSKQGCWNRAKQVFPTHVRHDFPQGKTLFPGSSQLEEHIPEPDSVLFAVFATSLDLCRASLVSVQSDERSGRQQCTEAASRLTTDV